MAYKMVYDESEKSNVETFKRLPSDLQCLITETQAELQNVVRNFCLTHGYQKFYFTSGFRSVPVNQKYKGKPDSLHLFGYAIDFVVEDNLSDVEADVIHFNTLNEDYQMILENNHIHLQVSRNK